MSPADSIGRPFDIVSPQAWTLPVVLNSPHSGTLVPETLLNQSALSERDLRRSEDSHVDELFMPCVAHGAPMLRARISRAYIDLNREPFELDPRMFENPLPHYVNATSPRVLAGLGTIPRLVGEGEMIYRGKLAWDDAVRRIETVYRPYHKTLATMLDQVHTETGFACLVDCHSMPASAVHSNRHGAREADVILGDRFGAACAPAIVEAWYEAFTGAGLRVKRNHPYPGGFITENHGNPRLGRHALQIELNRALYLLPNGGVIRNNFNQLSKVIEQAFEQFLGALPSTSVTPDRRAAAQ